MSDGTTMSATDSLFALDSAAHGGCPSAPCSPLRVLVACEYSADQGCRDWPCEVHEKDQVNGNPHMQIIRAATPKEALAAYRVHMEATHQHLGTVTLIVRTGKSTPPTCTLRSPKKARSRKGQARGEEGVEEEVTSWLC